MKIRVICLSLGFPLVSDGFFFFLISQLFFGLSSLIVQIEEEAVCNIFTFDSLIHFMRKRVSPEVLGLS